MGNTGISTFLYELAKDWDCLEGIQRFKHEEQPSEKSQKAETEHRNEQTPKKQQPRRMIQPNVIQTLLQEPPQVKILQPSIPQSSIKRRSNLRVKQRQSSHQNSKQKIEDISQISNDPEPHNNTNDLEIIEIEKDLDIRANNMKKFTNPLFRTTNDFRPQRQPPLIQANTQKENNGFDDFEISEINEIPTHDYQNKFFINRQDQEQYNNQMDRTPK